MTTNLKFLIGYTKNDTILIGEIQNRNGQFSFCCDEEECVFLDSDAEENAVSSFLLCRGDDIKYQLCRQYDCSPRELKQTLVYKFDQDMFFDIDYTFDIDGYVFNFVACGQLDPRECDISQLYISQSDFDFLMNCWDNYHLKDIQDVIWNTLYNELESASVYEDDVISWVENILK